MAANRTKYEEALDKALAKILEQRGRAYGWKLFRVDPRMQLDPSWENYAIPHNGTAATTQVVIRNRQYWVVGALESGDGEALLANVVAFGLLGASGKPKIFFTLCDSDPSRYTWHFFTKEDNRYFTDRKSLEEHLS